MVWLRHLRVDGTVDTGVWATLKAPSIPPGRARQENHAIHSIENCALGPRDHKANRLGTFHAQGHQGVRPTKLPSTPRVTLDDGTVNKTGQIGPRILFAISSGPCNIWITRSN